MDKIESTEIEITRETNTKVDNTIEKLKNKSIEDGILMGFSSFNRLKKYNKYFEERNVDFINPFEVSFEEGDTILKNNYLVFLFPYLTKRKLEILKTRMEDSNVNEGASIYTLSEDYHTLCRNFLEGYSEVLISDGYKAKIVIDISPISERTAAFDANLGFIGKNGILINEIYGSFCFIAIIATDIDLNGYFEKQRDISDVMSSKCKSCNNCIKECPVSILGGKYINTNKCLSFLTQSKNLSNKDLSKFKGRLFGCDTCQIVCPYNKLYNANGLKLSDLEQFELHSEYEDFIDKDLVYLNKKEFNELKKLSFSWRGKSLLQRNAAISLIDKSFDIDFNKFGSEKLKEELASYNKYRGD